MWEKKERKKVLDTPDIRDKNTNNNWDLRLSYQELNFPNFFNES